MSRSSLSVTNPEVWERETDVAHVRSLLSLGWTLALIADTYAVPRDLIVDLALEGY